MNKGYLVILTGYIGWGLFPLYWTLLTHVSPTEVLLHRMLPMTRVGILFYLTPSLQFLSGVVILGEAFNLDKLVGFIDIWFGLAIFSYSLRQVP